MFTVFHNFSWYIFIYFYYMKFLLKWKVKTEYLKNSLWNRVEACLRNEKPSEIWYNSFKKNKGKTDMKKILIVEDEKPISDIIKFNMTREGYEVVTAFDGRQALEVFEAEMPDIVILDWMLPEIDGLEVARNIRKTSNVPILMLSAKDSEFDKVIGLEIGADDYVTKPFSNRELQARVKALLRRSELSETQVDLEVPGGTEMVIGDLVILPDAFVAKKHGKELDLTHREFELLHHLANHLGQVMTRDHLLETVWGYDYFGDVRTVDVTIRRLRENIEDIPSRPEYILTRRGVGYYIKAND